MKYIFVSNNQWEFKNIKSSILQIISQFIFLKLCKFKIEILMIMSILAHPGCIDCADSLIRVRSHD